MRYTFLLAAVITLGDLCAQCDLAINNYTVNVGCSLPAYFPDAVVGIDGGTAPYHLRFTTNSGWVTDAQTNVGHWNGYVTNGITPDHMATLEVTDAEGCMAMSEAHWLPHWPIEPTLAISRTCDGMVRFEWNGQFRLAFPVLDPVPYACPGPMYYSVYCNNGPEITGQVTADWVQITPGTWRFEVPVSLDPFWVFVRNQDGSCANWNEVYCHEFVNVSASSLPAPVGCSAQLRVRAALGGVSWSGALMNDQLRSGGLVPANEPFTSLGYAYVGTAAGQSIAPGLLSVTGNDAIVDWVLLELRNAGNPGTVSHSRPALLQRDGDVVGLNGQAIHTLPFTSGTHHIALRHRNHLGVMTATPRTLNATETMVDFTLSSTATYGTNARVNVNGIMAMPSGDTNGSGSVSYTGAGNDRDVVLLAIGGSVPTNTLNNVYDRRDVNLDGKVMYTGTGNDRDVILQAIGGTVPTAVRTQQLP